MAVRMNDLAGTDYWNRVWAAEAKPAFNPEAIENRALVRLLRRFLATAPKGGLIIEAGCADSVVMPYIHGLGYRTAGLDYSEPGCDKFRLASPLSEAHCCDIFDPPGYLLGRSDAIYSLGLVEHFTDTREVIDALARFLKPVGTMLTIVPNMHGTVGALQKCLNRRAFDVHVALTPRDLRHAHSGLSATEYGYLSPVGYGVVNHGYKPLPRAVVGFLSRASMPLLALDERHRLPRTRMFSPHAYCIARKVS